jgi:hypothetical protein
MSYPPNDFPLPRRDEVVAYMSPFAAGDSNGFPAWLGTSHPGRAATDEDVVRFNESAGGSNGAFFRFFGCATHDENFQRMMNATPRDASFEGRANEESVLFDFFLSGLSSVECAIYALYMYASVVDGVSFPVLPYSSKKRMIDPLENIDPQKVYRLFSIHFPSDNITDFLASSIRSNEFKLWQRRRNILYHRAAPPRRMNLALTIDAPAQRGADTWRLGNITIEAALTGDARRWLSNWHTEFWGCTLEFVQAHRP